MTPTMCVAPTAVSLGSNASMQPSAAALQTSVAAQPAAWPAKAASTTRYAVTVVRRFVEASAAVGRVLVGAHAVMPAWCVVAAVVRQVRRV